MKKQIAIIALLLGSIYTQAQEVFVNADVVSRYIWRGIDQGNVSIQPSLEVQWKGLSACIDGSTELRGKNNEIDLSLAYEIKNFTLYANNYFSQTEDGAFKYFNYRTHSTGHTFEVGAAYKISEQFPLSVGWYTTFAGNDYNEDNKRVWSSYCELGYPFSIKSVEMSVEAGFTPWESFYADKLNVVNLGLTATKELKITSGFSLSVFGKLIANPYTEKVYFVFGISL